MDRFLPDVERRRRAAGWILSLFGLIQAALLTWALLTFGRASLATLALLALALGLLAWGLRLALRREVAIEVDVDRRTYTVVRKDGRSSGSLDDLGPLAVTRRERVVGSRDKRQTIVEYVVNATTTTHGRIDLHVEDTAGQARRKMERLGRRWQLSCQSLGGEVRAADELDQPLHRRLRGDAAALQPVPLRPEWRLEIATRPSGRALVSAHRSWAPLVSSAVILAPTAFVLVIAWNIGLWSILADATGDELERGLAGLLGLIALALLWKAAGGLRDTFFPGEVVVNARGVSYRGRRLPFDRVEEVVAGLPIEVAADRRSLVLATSFCPPEATRAVAHEIQRLILEAAPRP